MLDNLNKYKIILASGSPRRRELLEGLGLSFTVKCIDGIDESYPESLPAEETALFIAKKKSEAYKGLTDSGHLIITADTVVVCNDMVLGKPSNKNEAKKMLINLFVEKVIVEGPNIHTYFNIGKVFCSPGAAPSAPK